MHFFLTHHRDPLQEEKAGRGRYRQGRIWPSRRVPSSYRYPVQCFRYVPPSKSAPRLPLFSVRIPPSDLYDCLGPTSAPHLLHSQATINPRIYENYDLRYHHAFEISKSGEGLITVRKPAADEQQLSQPKPVDLHIEREVIEQLVNTYFTEVAPILPVVTQAEFLATPNPPPILLYSMCLVAAARREVPQAIFDSIRYAVNNIIKADDVLSTPSIPNVQALLILCMTGDCHSQFVPNALSALWVRLGTAIRMVSTIFQTLCLDES